MAKTSTLIDSFTATSLNGSLWTYNALGGTVSYGSGGVTLSSYSPQIISNSTFDLTNSYAFLKIINQTWSGGSGGGGGWINFVVGDDAGVNYININIVANYGGSINVAGGSRLFVNSNSGGSAISPTTGGSVPNLLLPIYVRSSIASGTLYCDYSYDANTWVNFASYASLPNLTSSNIQMQNSQESTTFNSLNYTPPATLTGVSQLTGVSSITF